MFAGIFANKSIYNKFAYKNYKTYIISIIYYKCEFYSSILYYIIHISILVYHLLDKITKMKALFYFNTNCFFSIYNCNFHLYKREIFFFRNCH